MRDMRDSWLKNLIAGNLSERGRARALALYVFRQFGRDQCIGSAAMLAYATLLALVPLTAVALAIASAFPTFESVIEQARSFLFQNFVPAARESVEQYLLEFATKASQLTGAMSIALVASALLLMANIDATLNRIWNVSRSRNFVNRIMVYWTALSMGPILLGLSVGLSSYFFSLSIIDQTRRVIPITLLAPFAFATLGFFLLFMIVPNRRVPWRHALIGGLCTAAMFEIAKAGFGFYIGQFNSYERIYGAVATVPIFLVWLYVSWAVILLGASFTASLGSFRYHEPGNWRSEHEFVLLYRLVGHLWNAQRNGEGLTSQALLDLEPAADDQQLQPLLDNLAKSKLVARDEREAWVLVRDPAEVSLAELYATGRYTLPLDVEAWKAEDPADRWNAALARVISNVNETADGQLGTTLKSLYVDRRRSMNTPPNVTLLK